MSRLLEELQLAKKDLSLDIVIPFNLPLSSGIIIKSQALLKNFGAKNGMLIISKYDQVADHLEELSEKGYGFSVLDEPTENEDYKRSEYIEMLKDWGWSGNLESTPEWLKM